MSVYVPDPALNDWVPLWNLGNNVPAAQPACRVANTGTQTLANSGTTTLTFNSERFDTDNMHDLVTNPQRLTIQTPGKYNIGANIHVGPGSGTPPANVDLLLYRGNDNLLLAIDRRIPISGYGVEHQVSIAWDCAVGDWFYLAVQIAGTGVVSPIVYGTPQGPYGCEFWAALIGGMQGPAGSPRITTTSGIATAPPNPQDGDLWICPVATQSGYMRWMFQYVASRAAWDFVGGPPLEIDYDAGVATSSGAYADLGGPQITIPRAGDYQVEFGCGMSPTAGQTVANASMGIRRSSDNAIFTGVTMELYNTPAGGYYRAASRSFRAAAAATGEIWLSMYSVSNATNVTFNSRWMKIIPQTVR